MEGGQTGESFSALHSTPGRYVSIDGGNSVGGNRCVPATPGLCFAGGRLSDYPGDYVLSGGESGCDGLGSHCSARTAVWASAGSEPDDLNEFGRQLGNHLAVFA